MTPSLDLEEAGPVSGVPIARAKTGAVIEERALIQRRLEQAEERRAWDRLRELRTILAA